MGHQRVNENKQGPAGLQSILKIATVCLAAVSFWATAQGMNGYVFNNEIQAYLASFAVQGLLLALNFYFPHIWANRKNSTKVIIVFLTAVVVFCSSWFSYVFIADKLYETSWPVESQIVIQEAYREELYAGEEYARTYRTEIEKTLANQILELDQAAQKADGAGSPATESGIDWESERAVYQGTNEAMGDAMFRLIERVQTALAENATAEERNLAKTALETMERDVKNRLEEIEKELTRLNDANTSTTANLDNVQRQINNAAAGTDTEDLEQTRDRLSATILRYSEQQTELENERKSLEGSKGKITEYRRELELADATSILSVRDALREMQKELFKEDANADALMMQATAVFENLRDTTEENTENDQYLQLLTKMNAYVQNLRDYTTVKQIEAELRGMIEELSESATGLVQFNVPNSGIALPESSSKPQASPGSEPQTNPGSEPQANPDSEPQANPASEPQTDIAEPQQWRQQWSRRIENLKAQLSRMPSYTGGENALLMNYSRVQATRHLDTMTQKYIIDHNAAEQGIIYLLSPNFFLGIFALLLALFFDIAGFIAGAAIVNSENAEKAMEEAAQPWEEVQTKTQEAGAVGTAMKNENQLPIQMEEANDWKNSLGFAKRKNRRQKVTWTVKPTLHQYIILTGDYRRINGEYVYEGFENGVKIYRCIRDPIAHGAGILRMDGKGSGESPTPQELAFATMPEGSRDGVYYKCRLFCEDGMISIQRKEGEGRQYLANMDSNVPVYCYFQEDGILRVMPACEMKELSAESVVIALNKRGTMIVAVYIMA